MDFKSEHLQFPVRADFQSGLLLFPILRIPTDNPHGFTINMGGDDVSEAVVYKKV